MFGSNDKEGLESKTTQQLHIETHVKDNMPIKIRHKCAKGILEKCTYNPNVHDAQNIS